MCNADSKRVPAACILALAVGCNPRTDRETREKEKDRRFPWDRTNTSEHTERNSLLGVQKRVLSPCSPSRYCSKSWDGDVKKELHLTLHKNGYILPPQPIALVSNLAPGGHKQPFCAALGGPTYSILCFGAKLVKENCLLNWLLLDKWFGLFLSHYLTFLCYD